MGNNSVEQNRRFWSRYDWSGGGDEWSLPWGSTPMLWYGTIMPRIAGSLPARTILEIAPGGGRFTQFLKDHCRRYIGVDLSPTCVETCRRRFRDHPHMTFLVNDGRSLDLVADDSVDFVFSYDSLVHVEADVLESYAHQLARKLVVGGTGFLHFSNFLKVREAERAAGATPAANGHNRAPNMSGDLFAAYCRDAGLALLTLELIDWGPPESDALALFARLPQGTWPATKRSVNNDYWADAARLATLNALYARADSDPTARVAANSP